MQLGCFVQPGKELLFIEKTQQLGHKSLILIYVASDSKKLSLEYKKELKNTFNGELLFFLDCKNQKEAQIQGFDGYLQLGTRNSSFFPGITHVYNNELEQEKDFMHQRRGGINHILLREMEEKNITLLLNCSLLTAKELGRVQQNSKLAKKFAVSTVVVQLVSEAQKIASAKDIYSFQQILQ